MITGQSYKEYLLEQGQIQKDIVEGWGYSINPKQFIPVKEKVSTNIKVASITPLKKVFDIPISHELAKVEEELLMLQNQRKLNELAEKAQQVSKDSEDVQDSAVIKMMRQCVQQYNFIIDHRHIKQKNTEKARRIMGIQKSQSKQLFEQIHSLKQQLVSSTLSNTIKINNQIAKLYKKYSQIIPKTINTQKMTQNKSSSVNHAYTSVNSEKNSQINFTSGKISPNKKTTTVHKYSSQKSEFKDSQTKKDSNFQLKDLVIMQQLNESQEGSQLESSRKIQEQLRYEPQSLLIHHALKMQRRISEYVPRRRFITLADIKQKQKEQKKERMATTIEQAYQKKEIINKGKKLDKILQEHSDVAQVWKQRINQNSQKNRNFQLKIQPKMKAKRFVSVKNTKRGDNEDEAKQIQQASTCKVYYRAQEIKQDLVQKQRILSNILRKKQSKYKRIPGTQIMQKNDVNSTAKTFLGISKKDQNRKKKTQTSEKNIMKIVIDKPQWQNLQKDDEKMYWSMCKNEKLNLLLKNKKQQ